MSGFAGKIGQGLKAVAGAAGGPMAVAGGVGSALFLGPLVAKSVRQAASDPFKKELGQTREALLYQAVERVRAERLARLQAENEVRLASFDPGLYAQLEAGRRLPLGGRVFGGRPNRDVLDKVTMAMSQGRIGVPSAEEGLAELMQ